MYFGVTFLETGHYTLERPLVCTKGFFVGEEFTRAVEQTVSRLGITILQLRVQVEVPR